MSMKIIVSTKAFSNSIRQALSIRSYEFELIAEKSEIVFTGNRTIYGSIATTQEYKNYKYKGIFYPVQWFKILTFLKQLEEQPIVIEFDYYSDSEIHENPQIDLSQFVKRFKCENGSF